MASIVVAGHSHIVCHGANVHASEMMFLYPVERTLLTSGMVITAVESLYQKQVEIETPDLAVRYQSNPKSVFWRE